MISKNQIKHIRQLEQKKYRQREGLFVAEGPKVVGDLLRAGYRPEALYVAEADRWSVEGVGDVPCMAVTADELRRVSFLQHPQQVLGVFPLQRPPFTVHPHQALALALDGVQDPGNLGTIIRVADWFGIETIYCSEDTVDAWNPKVVQATMGSIARVNMVYCQLASLMDSLPEDYPVYGTLLDGENIYSQQLTSYGIIVMGNEGNGISADIRERVNRRLFIPDFHQGADTADSLNVAIATAITCSEFRRGPQGP